MNATRCETGVCAIAAGRRYGRASAVLAIEPIDRASAVANAMRTLEDMAHSLRWGEAERSRRRERACRVDRAEIVEIGGDGIGGALGDGGLAEIRIDGDAERAARVRRGGHGG